MCLSAPSLSPMPALDLPELLSRRAAFLSFVKRRVNDRTLAEDILQAAYMRALETARGEYPPRPDSSTAWFYSVLRNAIIDQYRRGASESSAMERLKTEIGDAEPASSEPASQDFVCGCIEHVLPQLRPAYAELLREVDLAETPLTEFAERHHLSVGNAGVRAHRARAALRKALSEFCGACSLEACLNCICKQPACRTGSQHA